jgi:hypothetical protein
MTRVLIRAERPSDLAIDRTKAAMAVELNQKREPRMARPFGRKFAKDDRTAEKWAKDVAPKANYVSDSLLDFLILRPVEMKDADLLNWARTHNSAGLAREPSA